MFHRADIFFIFAANVDPFYFDLFIDLHLGANDFRQLAFQCFCQIFRCDFCILQNAYSFFIDENSRAILSDSQKYNKQHHNDADQIQHIAVQFSAAFSGTFSLRFLLISFMMISFTMAVAAFTMTSFTSALSAAAISDRLAAAVRHAFLPFGKHCIGHGNSPYSSKNDKVLQILLYAIGRKIASKSASSSKNC